MQQRGDAEGPTGTQRRLVSTYCWYEKRSLGDAVVVLLVVSLVLTACQGGLGDDQRSWCDSHVSEMFDTAMALELVNLDEVAQLMLDIPEVGPLPVVPASPESTKEELLRLFEDRASSHAEIRRRHLVGVWARTGRPGLRPSVRGDLSRTEHTLNRGGATHNHAHLTLVSDIQTERYPAFSGASSHSIQKAP